MVYLECVHPAFLTTFLFYFIQIVIVGMLNKKVVSALYRGKKTFSLIIPPIVTIDQAETF